MRPRVVAVSTATLIAAASLTPIIAEAAGQNTLFVNSASPACSDSGTGTAAAPYCTLQAAADAAGPGDVLNVAPGAYAPTTFTQSGTATNPITVTGNGVWSAASLWGLGPAATAPLAFSGASYVNVEDFEISNGAAADAVVDASSGITFDHDSFATSTTGLPAVHVTDGSSAVTVQDSYVGSGLIVDGGSTGTVVTTDRLSSNYMTPVSIIGAADTAITSNTINGCGAEIAVTGSATGTSIENNVAESPEIEPSSTSCPVSAQGYSILVDSGSAPSTTADYNDIYNAAGAATYEWAGAGYTTAAALYAATGQGRHDDNSALGIQRSEHSPLINSANSAAVGEQPTDINGDPRTLDPLVTPTGAGPYDDYDRGAYQFQDPYTAVAGSTLTSSATQAPTDAAFTLHAAFADTWNDTFSSYEFAIASPNGTTTVTSGAGNDTTVTLPVVGNYTIGLYGEPTGTTSYVYLSSQALIFVRAVAPAPLVARESLSLGGLLGVWAADQGTTDAWNIRSVTFNFGDGSPTQTVADGAVSMHTYALPGTYTVTETVTDAGGNTATTSARVTPAAPQPSSSSAYGLGPGDASVQEWVPGSGWAGIGGPASAVYAGASGVFAVSPDGSKIYEYEGGPGVWSQVGGSGAQFVVSGDSLYALAANRSYVARWNGSGTSWTVIGGPAQAIYPAANGVFATSPGNKAIYKYTSGSWAQVGGAGAQFATDGNTLYGLGPNDSYVSAWNGSKWTVVGGPASRIYAGGAGLFAVNPGDTGIYQLGSSTDTWTRVGGGGVAFAVSQTNLFGQSLAGGPVYEYSGTPGSWTNIGGDPTSIVGG